MSSKVIKSRRVWGVVLPLVAVLALFFAFGPGAVAVHDIDAFELEGNATNEATAGDDWANVCHEFTITLDTTNQFTNQCASASDTTAYGGANAVSFLQELDRNATIFTGGGSKDPEPLSAWKHKDGAGGLPDKDNLLHSFAARYNVPATEFPTGACGTGATSCDVLYFGMDRFDNSGDAQNGFWFFQDEVAPDPDNAGKFSGEHTVGDLLILTNFSNGGDVSTINIYQWVGSGGDTNGTLDFLAGGPAHRCGGTGDDPFCGIVNPSNGTTAPWSFTDKSGNNTFLNGEFFEGGVNLSSPQINLDGKCFNSFLSESRASTSPSATLKDFVLGEFGACTSSISSTQSWTPNDSATIDVTGTDDWTGTVTFTLYSGTDCTGTIVYGPSDAIAVDDDDPTALATDGATDPTAISTTGTTQYRWKVVFTSPTQGVPPSESCIEATTLNIDNDTSN